MTLVHQSGSLEAGSCWRRKKDGVVYEIVHQSRRTGDLQVRRAGAKNLKNTNWISPAGLAARYEPADAPPPPTLADRIRETLAIPGDPKFSVTVQCGFGWNAGTSWGVHATEFAKRAEDVRWKWMNMPENAKRSQQDGWFSLRVFGKIDGVCVELDGGAGWTKPEADVLTAALRAAKVKDEETRTPFPYAYAGAGS